ncbi:MAG TPA: hypothetical protein VLL94_15015 [Nitrospiraceae bacterium]|nr:hypothetical protein [Nitrospiraceae bacterium]
MWNQGEGFILRELNLSRLFLLSSAFSLCIFLTGCLSPIAMHRAVIEYDRTVHRVEAELLLLNIARARHYRPVHFTAVTSVAATFDFRVKAGVLGRISRGAVPDDSLVDLNYGTEVAENPTVTIVPVSGEEFTKRILRPLDESHLNFLVRQGFDLSMVLRLLGRGILIDGEETPLILFNTPSRREDYTEFRRRLLHLSSLDFQKRLYITPVVYEEAFPVSLEKGLTPAEVVAAIDRGYRWSVPTDDRPAILVRRVTGRLAITNYDLKRLGNDERTRLNVEIDRLPADHVFVDIRSGFPGGEYPLKGSILLRSFNSIISFVARGIAEDAGYHVDPDPRTGPVQRNPAHVLEIEESLLPLKDAEFDVEFEGKYYSIRKFPISEGMVPSWNQEAFAVLANLFQMTVTDVSNVKTPIISIPKG